MRSSKSARVFIVNYDIGILLSFLALSVFGLLILLDIGSVRDSMSFCLKQLLFYIPAGFAFVFAFYKLDLVKLKNYVPHLFILTVLLLLAVLAFGSSVKGATRSINLGIINFQPSFFARLVLIVLFASVLSKKNELLQQSDVFDFLKNFAPLIMFSLIIFGLVYMEKHLSTLIISGCTLAGMLWLAGMKPKVMFTLLVVGLLLFVLILKTGSSYRGDRMEIYKKYSLFFAKQQPKSEEEAAKIAKEKAAKNGGKEEEPVDDYQVRESMTALSNGGFFGTGPAKGRAKQYYLPEARTDYVFTVIGEEFGFMGAMVIFGLHCFLFYRAMLASLRKEDLYLQLLGMGFALNLFCNVLVNVGVAMSALPSTGITLPFISYGGTSLVIDALSVGILLNVSSTKKVVG